MPREFGKPEGIRMPLKKGFRRLLIPVLIILIQTLCIVHWGNEKQNYYIDELFSMGYAQDFFAQREAKRYFHAAPDIVLQEWIDIRQIKHHLTVEPDETVDAHPLSVTLPRFFSFRSYFGLLNIAEGVLSPGEVSKKAGLTINLITFLLLQTVFYRFLGRLKVRDPIRWLALVFFGSGCLISGLAVFIRFYLITNLFLLLICDLHLIMWQTDKMAPFCLAEAGSFLLMLLSFHNSELTLVLSGSLVVLFTIGLTVRKRFLRAAVYGGPVLAGGFLYLFRHTSYIRLLTDLPSFLKQGGTQGTLASHVLSTTPAAVEAYLRDNLVPAYEESVFGARWLMTAFGIAFIVLLISAVLRLRDPDSDPDTFPKPGNRLGFMLILAGILAVYGIFMLMARFEDYDHSSRYHSFGMVLFITLFWYAVDRLLSWEGEKTNRRRVLTALLAVLVVTQSVTVFTERKIPYLFPEDKAALTSWQEVSTYPQIIDWDNFFTLYDAVAHIPDGTQTMLVTRWTLGTIQEFPDAFVLWNTTGQDQINLIGTIHQRGYEVTHLGNTQLSSILLCTKEGNKE